jgi:hypothetical protein
MYHEQGTKPIGYRGNILFTFERDWNFEYNTDSYSVALTQGKGYLFNSKTQLKSYKKTVYCNSGKYVRNFHTFFSELKTNAFFPLLGSRFMTVPSLARLEDSAIDKETETCSADGFAYMFEETGIKFDGLIYVKPEDMVQIHSGPVMHGTIFFLICLALCIWEITLTCNSMLSTKHFKPKYTMKFSMAFIFPFTLLLLVFTEFTSLSLFFVSTLVYLIHSCASITKRPKTQLLEAQANRMRSWTNNIIFCLFFFSIFFPNAIPYITPFSYFIYAVEIKTFGCYPPFFKSMFPLLVLKNAIIFTIFFTNMYSNYVYVSITNGYPVLALNLVGIYGLLVAKKHSKILVPLRILDYADQSFARKQLSHRESGSGSSGETENLEMDDIRIPVRIGHFGKICSREIDIEKCMA